MEESGCYDSKPLAIQHGTTNHLFPMNNLLATDGSSRYDTQQPSSKNLSSIERQLQEQLDTQKILQETILKQRIIRTRLENEILRRTCFPNDSPTNSLYAAGGATSNNAPTSLSHNGTNRVDSFGPQNRMSTTTSLPEDEYVLTDVNALHLLPEESITDPLQYSYSLSHYPTPKYPMLPTTYDAFGTYHGLAFNTELTQLSQVSAPDRATTSWRSNNDGSIGFPPPPGFDPNIESDIISEIQNPTSTTTTRIQPNSSLANNDISRLQMHPSSDDDYLLRPGDFTRDNKPKS
jgi:hypothetical protein